MKRIEDIEKLSLEELESASAGVEVPEGLRQRIGNALLAEDTMASAQRKEAASRHMLVRGVIPAFAAAAAVLAAVLLLPGGRTTPKDSFDDPALAYAQVEKTFQYISQKMSGGVGMVREAGSVINRPEQIINKINGK